MEIGNLREDCLTGSSGTHYQNHIILSGDSQPFTDLQTLTFCMTELISEALLFRISDTPTARSPAGPLQLLSEWKCLPLESSYISISPLGWPFTPRKQVSISARSFAQPRMRFFWCINRVVEWHQTLTYIVAAVNLRYCFLKSWVMVTRDPHCRDWIQQPSASGASFEAKGAPSILIKASFFCRFFIFLRYIQF